MSHHLSLLADAGLITKEKVGRWVNCTVVPERLAQLCAPSWEPEPAWEVALHFLDQRRSIMMHVDVDPIDVVKALGEPLRWRIVELLAAEELCVCHLVEELDIVQPLVSHHLKVLREAGLVESERFRYWTYYRLRTETVADIARALGRLAEQAPTGSKRRRPCC